MWEGNKMSLGQRRTRRARGASLVVLAGIACAGAARDGRLKWRYATGGPVRSSPAVGRDGTVYRSRAENVSFVLAVRRP